MPSSVKTGLLFSFQDNSSFGWCLSRAYHGSYLCYNPTHDTALRSGHWTSGLAQSPFVHRVLFRVFTAFKGLLLRLASYFQACFSTNAGWLWKSAKSGQEERGQKQQTGTSVLTLGFVNCAKIFSNSPSVLYIFIHIHTYVYKHIKSLYLLVRQ